MKNAVTDVELKKVGDLIAGIKVAMLTTSEQDGTLHSRPMHSEAMDEDGSLWFFTQASSAKVDELMRNPNVSVTYADDDGDACVAIAGHGTFVRDQAKIRELWKPFHKAWFPKGLEDPELSLLRVSIDRAEYWESPSTTVVKLWGFAKALATGQSAGEEIGQHEKINR